MKRRAGLALLVCGSSFFALLLAEAAARLLEGRATLGLQAVPFTSQKLGSQSLQDAIPHIKRMPEVVGIERKWFDEDPPPLPRGAVPPEMQRRYKDFEKRGLYGPQAQYVWNRKFVMQNMCGGAQSVFANYPNTVLVFDSPSGSPHPRFRFPANATLPSGLVTNQFGLRGPQIQLQRPANTIRLAFVGASTTVNTHSFAYSYPERVVNWLERFAAAKGWSVRFELLNAGREGINSNDIEAIVRDELIPLKPDLIVYYEGSNQFSSANQMVFPPIPPRKSVDPPDLHQVPAWARNQSAFARLLDRAFSRHATTVGEPLKPPYWLIWPSGVTEGTTDPDIPTLPLQLPVIRKDLDSIRDALHPIGGELAMSSFVWLAEDGMRIQPGPHRFIYEQLNTVLWPLSYRDIRRLADFQNSVFRQYAKKRGIHFLDIAAYMPKDNDLFSDAIHMTELGERVKAWVSFLQLAPLLQEAIASGRLPKKQHALLNPDPPSLGAETMTMDCNSAPELSGSPFRLTTALQLASIALAYNQASIERGKQIKVTTADGQGAYAASIPFVMDRSVKSKRYVQIRARVLNGQVGFGIQDRRSGNLLIERTVGPSPAFQEVYIPIDEPGRSDDLIIRNNKGGTRSEVLLEDVAVMASARQVRHLGVGDKLEAADPRARISRGKTITIVTAPERWAYAAALPLELGPGGTSGMMILVRGRVLGGEIGIGVLTADKKTFTVEQMFGASNKAMEATIPLPESRLVSDLIIRNTAKNSRSTFVLEELSLWQLQ